MMHGRLSCLIPARSLTLTNDVLFQIAFLEQRHTCAVRAWVGLVWMIHQQQGVTRFEVSVGCVWCVDVRRVDPAPHTSAL